jgi:hypothetical protein
MKSTHTILKECTVLISPRWLYTYTTPLDTNMEFKCCPYLPSLGKCRHQIPVVAGQPGTKHLTPLTELTCILPKATTTSYHPTVVPHLLQQSIRTLIFSIQHGHNQRTWCTKVVRRSAPTKHPSLTRTRSPLLQSHLDFV